MLRAKPSFWAYLACYVLWAATVAQGLVNGLILRQWVRENYVRLGLDSWGFSAVDQAGLIVIALLLLAGLIALEYYYRGGVEKGRLLRRFRNCTVALLIVPAVRLVEIVVT
jgi:hypothetical protein